MNILPTPIGDPAARRAVALTIWTAMGLIAVLVLARSVSGAMTQPLPSIGLVAWTFSGAAFSLVAGHWLPNTEGTASRGPWIGCGIALLFSAAWLPAATPFQCGLIAGVALLHGGLLGINSLSGRRQPPGSTFDLTSGPINQSAQYHETDAPRSEEGAPPDSAAQWMVRRAEDDSEICEGHVRVEFAAGQREATVHLAFCPPLCGVPDVELEDLDGVGCELKVTAAYPYGLRLTVRRTVRQIGAESGRIAYWASATRTERQSAA